MKQTKRDYLKAHQLRLLEAADQMLYQAKPSKPTKQKKVKKNGTNEGSWKVH